MDFFQNQDITWLNQSLHGCHALCYLFYISLFGHNMSLETFFSVYIEVCDVCDVFFLTKPRET